MPRRRTSKLPSALMKAFMPTPARRKRARRPKAMTTPKAVRAVVRAATPSALTTAATKATTGKKSTARKSTARARRCHQNPGPPDAVIHRQRHVAIREVHRGSRQSGLQRVHPAGPAPDHAGAAVARAARLRAERGGFRGRHPVQRPGRQTQVHRRVPRTVHDPQRATLLELVPGRPSVPRPG